MPTFHFTPENWPHHITVWCDQFTPHGHITLQWATVSRVQRSKWSESSSVVSNSLWPHGLYSPWNSPGQNTEWVAFPFSSGSSQPRDWTQVSRIAGRFFTCCTTREAHEVKRLWILINNGNAQHRHFWFFLSVLWRVGQCTEYSVTSLSILSGWWNTVELEPKNFSGSDISSFFGCPGSPTIFVSPVPYSPLCRFKGPFLYTSVL